MEHRDGKVDQRFARAVRGFWFKSTWGRRLDLENLDKIAVEEEDVIATCDAMLNVTSSRLNRLGGICVRKGNLSNGCWSARHHP